MEVATADYAVNAAHNNAIAAYKYFLLRFGRDSFDGKGTVITSKVHYGYPIKIKNAFWDHNAMIYGDGDGVNTKALCYGLDIVAHVSIFQLMFY